MTGQVFYFIYQELLQAAVDIRLESYRIQIQYAGVVQW